MRRTGPLLQEEQRLDRRAAAQKLYADLVARGEEWADLGSDLSDGTPRPLPQMQITPIY